MISKELKNNDDIFKNVFENSCEAILLLDSNKNIIDCNKSLVKLLVAASKIDLVNKPLAETIKAYPLSNPFSSFDVNKKIDKVILDGTGYFECDLKSLNDETIIAGISVSKINPDADNSVLQITIKDLCEQKETEKILAQKNKLDSIGQLASSVAHDFNNLLGGIMSSADLLLLRDKSDDPKNTKLLSLILKTVKRATDLNNNLLTFSHKKALRVSIMSTNSIVEQSISQLNDVLSENIEIEFNNNAISDTIAGDKLAIQNVIFNLVVNASQAMLDDGKILIETQNKYFDKHFNIGSFLNLEPSNYIIISVIDSGCGIPIENIDSIFKPFFTSKQSESYLGLGLSTVYSTIKTHNGAIEVKSEKDKETLFNIYLPCSQED